MAYEMRIKSIDFNLVESTVTCVERDLIDADLKSHLRSLIVPPNTRVLQNNHRSTHQGFSIRELGWNLSRERDIQSNFHLFHPVETRGGEI